jgi:hypothetical protein
MKFAFTIFSGKTNNMQSKKELFDELTGGTLPSRTLFRPILMNFAARFGGATYGEFASDYKTLVDCNIRSMEYFDTDMAPEEIETKVSEMVSSMKGQKYILSAGCEITVSTDPENLLAMSRSRMV